MLKSVLTLCFLGFAGSAVAQQQYLVKFTDKGPEAAAHRLHPQSFLSAQALDRKTRYQIPLTEQDLPVSGVYLHNLQQAGVQVLQKSKWLNLALVSTTLTEDQLKETIGVASVKAVGTKKEGDSYQKWTAPTNQRQHSTDYGAATQQIEQLKLNCLHNQGYRGQNVKVAVFDTGFPGVNTVDDFDSLNQQNRILATRDFNNGSTNVFGTHDHGTMVFSTMAANNPGTFVGAAPNATYALAITEYMPSETHQEELNWAAAAEWADSLGMDIIQSSLSYRYFDAGQGDYADADLDGRTALITQAATIATRKGILVVNSAGNNGTGAPSPLISPPSDADSILAVGAVNQNNVRASLSSVGPTADGRIKPDVMAKGQGTAILNTAGNVITQNGTSLSAPLISSLAACLWQANPSKTNMQIRQAILESADKFTSPNNMYGYGLPNACKADSLLKGLVSAYSELPGNQFAVYPTITNDNITVAPAASGLVLQTIEVYSATGRLVQRHEIMGTNQPVLLSIGKEAAGIYLLRLATDNGDLQTTKIIKQ